MSNGNGFLSGRFWLPGLIVGLLLFLGLSVFLGYKLLQNTSNDTNSVEKIREFQALSKNVLFFSNQIATGDAAAIDSSVTAVEKMDGILNMLLASDDFAKQELSKEYESAVNFWRSIKNNATILSEVSLALNQVNTTANNLEDTATEAQVLVTSIFGQMVDKKASSEQVAALSNQVLLLRQMANDMSSFSTELKSTSQSFDDYRAKLFSFQNNHRALLDGDAVQKIRPLRSKELRDGVEGIYQLTQRTSISESDLISAVEALLLARDAQSKIVSSIEGLQFTLDEMVQGYEGLEEKRFPQPLYVIITTVLFALCLVGLIIVLRQSSQQEIEIEQSETENVQAAILRLLDELADLADGDLTVTTTVSEDFTGAIADSVNYTIDQLRQLVSRINNTAVRVSRAAQDSQQTALHLAEASDHQAQEIAGASAAINEMAVTIDQVSANAAESALVASKSVSIANNGAKLVQDTIHGMDTIREQIQDTSKRIKRLGESSQEIGDIISLINDIADQTNILALNAAIQASMAGDAGRGFAVVADEVQRLAERSAAATKQIETLVKTIQSDTNEAVISMEQTTTEVVGGARLAQDAGVALEEIEGVSANIAELIQNISNAARQQASSAGHISNTMNVIQEITSQTSAGTGATAQAIGELADMALELRESVAGFKLPDDMVDEDLVGAIDIDSEDWLSADDQDNAPSMATAPAGIAPIDNAESELSITDFDDDAIEKAQEFGVSEELVREAENDLAALFENTEDFDIGGEDFDLDDGDAFDLSDAEAFDMSNASSVDTSGSLAEQFDEMELDEVDLSPPPSTKPSRKGSTNKYAGVELTDDDFDLTSFEFDEVGDADTVR